MIKFVLFFQARFMCELCFKTFSWKHSLKEHLRGFHGYGEPFKCSKCHKKFNSRPTANRHMTKCTELGNNDNDKRN